MLESRLGFVFYTSTKGHFGRKEIYQDTLNNLYSQFPSLYSLVKVAHIKASPGEEPIAEDIEKWILEKDETWAVIKTIGSWSHGNPSHAVEYYKDMLTAFSHESLREIPYVLFNEDDFIWKVNGDKYLSYLFSSAISLLKQDENAMCVRINADTDLVNDKDKRTGIFYRQSFDRNQYGPTFTFQPTIVRRLEWYHALRLINKNSHILNSRHCELVSGDAMKNFSDSCEPFYYFDPNLVTCHHIGGPFE